MLRGMTRRVNHDKHPYLFPALLSHSRQLEHPWRCGPTRGCDTRGTAQQSDEQSARYPKSPGRRPAGHSAECWSAHHARYSAITRVSVTRAISRISDPRIVTARVTGKPDNDRSAWENPRNRSAACYWRRTSGSNRHGFLCPQDFELLITPEMIGTGKRFASQCKPLRISRNGVHPDGFPLSIGLA